MTENMTKNDSLATLTDRAVKNLNARAPKVTDWIRQLRPKDGTPGRFCWSIETTRDANVAASANILASLRPMGIWDEIITKDDIAAGVEWVRSMHIGNEQYRDPALLDRKPPCWPEKDPWPSSGILNVNNSYARNVLRQYLGEDAVSMQADMPPPDWPQPDTADTALEWIKRQPWDTNPWGAGAKSMRVARWLLRWYKEEKISIDPFIAAIRFFYEIQDPETGLWGGPGTPRNCRINGAFKLFVFIIAQLDLPLPHAEKIIDQVFLEFYRPDYDDRAGGCDEWDNWYVLCMTRAKTDGYREQEILKMAAWRIIRNLVVFGRPDGGLASNAKTCTSSWCGIDMAPEIPQGDAMGPGVVSSSIRACVDVLGIQDNSPWKNDKPILPRNIESEQLRAEIIERLK